MRERGRGSGERGEARRDGRLIVQAGGSRPPSEVNEQSAAFRRRNYKQTNVTL